MNHSFVTIVLAATMGFPVAMEAQQVMITPLPPRPLRSLSTTPLPPLFAERLMPDEEGRDKKDPAYKTYKEGYDAVLDERWNDAIKKFADVVAQYSKSDYVDDAEYWKAYALSHIDRKKAVEAYRRFMEKYPKSRYIDDAVADLGNLNPMVVVSTSGGDSTRVVVSTAPHAYSYSLGQGMGVADLQLRKAEAMERRLTRQLSRNFTPRPLHIPPMSMRIPSMSMWEVNSEEKLDPETRVRLDALYAIGDTKEDETSFQTLKDVALDHGQNIRLREAAIEVLSDFKKFDVMPVFLELAKKDTNERIQDVAIEFIGRTNKDKNKSVDALISLFNSIPPSQKERLENVLYTVADVGNDKAVDFLTKVARSHDNYELRSDAVYYLGTIGGERARTALYQILRDK